MTENAHFQSHVQAKDREIARKVQCVAGNIKS